MDGEHVLYSTPGLPEWFKDQDSPEMIFGAKLSGPIDQVTMVVAQINGGMTIEHVRGGVANSLMDAASYLGTMIVAGDAPSEEAALELATALLKEFLASGRAPRAEIVAERAAKKAMAH